LHQHYEWENERNAGQSAWPNLADKMGIDRRRHRDQDDVYDDVRRRKLQERSDNRAFKQKTCA
jgi:hypothetical protein